MASPSCRCVLGIYRPSWCAEIVVLTTRCQARWSNPTLPHTKVMILLFWRTDTRGLQPHQRDQECFLVLLLSSGFSEIEIEPTAQFLVRKHFLVFSCMPVSHRSNDSGGLWSISLPSCFSWWRSLVLPLRSIILCQYWMYAIKHLYLLCVCIYMCVYVYICIYTVCLYIYVYILYVYTVTQLSTL